LPSPRRSSEWRRSSWGTDTATELYWCNNSEVWNNDGDTAVLLDPSGNIVDSRSY
jgi:hypothetical protein